MILQRTILLLALTGLPWMAHAVETGDIEDISMQVLDAENKGFDRANSVRELSLPPAREMGAVPAAKTQAEQAKLDAKSRKEEAKAQAAEAKAAGKEQSEQAKAAAAQAREDAKFARDQAKEAKDAAKQTKQDAKDQAKTAKEAAKEGM